MKKIAIMGAGGFIGTNLIKALAENPENYILALDKNGERLDAIACMKALNVDTHLMDFNDTGTYEELLHKQDYLFHLVSTTVPTTSNSNIPRELEENVINTSRLLNVCIERKVGRVVFLSSGGTVYGVENICPLTEGMSLKPINSYGMQKMVIESLLYIYKYQFGLDYKVVRLSNPYGPYQRPDGIQGVVSTFIYKALHNEDIVIYGDGSIVRDYIYICDAISAILKVAFSDIENEVYNVGSGIGMSVNQVVDVIKKNIPTRSRIIYGEGRSVDVASNYLDISRFESVFGKMSLNSLEDGIKKTVHFFETGEYCI